jgi:hypothetical protein
MSFRKKKLKTNLPILKILLPLRKISPYLDQN